MAKLKGLRDNDTVAFLGFMDGFCGEFDEMPDGAWQAACESGVEAFNKDHRSHVDPYDGWMFWCEHNAAMSSK